MPPLSRGSDRFTRPRLSGVLSIVRYRTVISHFPGLPHVFAAFMHRTAQLARPSDFWGDYDRRSRAGAGDHSRGIEILLFPYDVPLRGGRLSGLSADLLDADGDG